MKKCSKCDVEKQSADFYVRTNGRRHAECKDCYKSHVRSYAVANKESIRAKAKVYGMAKRKRIKEATFAAYGGNVCACCGEIERKFLTLDHIHNNGAAFRRKISGNRQAAGYVTYSWLFRNGFPAGYQVLCMNCNHGKRMNNGVCPHKATCNDHPLVGVGPSGSKRIAPILKLVG